MTTGIKEAIDEKIREMEEETNRNQSSKTAIAIRYLLTNNTTYNQELAKKLMRWDHKETIKYGYVSQLKR